MHNHSEFLKRTCLGAASGFLGTLAIHTLMGAKKKWLPEAAPPIRQEPGDFMVKQAEEVLPSRIRRHIPETVETVAAKGLGVGYGMTFGALYAAVNSNGGNALLGGTALGLGCWGVGYPGWLPALELTPPLRDQTTTQIAGPIVEHLAYGLVTALAYVALCQWFDPAVPADADTPAESHREYEAAHI